MGVKKGEVKDRLDVKGSRPSADRKGQVSA